MGFSKEKKETKKVVFNKVINAGFWCYHVREIKKGLVLKCCFNSKDKDGDYSEPIYVDIICLEDKCDLKPPIDSLEKSIVNVDGTLFVSTVKPKKGDPYGTLSIFADTVRSKEDDFDVTDIPF